MEKCKTITLLGKGSGSIEIQLSEIGTGLLYTLMVDGKPVNQKDDIATIILKNGSKSGIELT